MKFSLTAAALAAVSAVSAKPIIESRDADLDLKILNFALLLEQAENFFYKEAVAKYHAADFVSAGFPASFYANLEEVAADEQTHVNFLTTALGANAIEPCTFAFEYATPAEFVALAQVIENVGTSAYLGAAALITDPTYLTAAGSILTVEARHNAYLRAVQKMLPFAQPFDIPLSYNEVFTIASAFVVSCPPGNDDKPQLPLKAFPALTSDAAGTIKSGDVITLLTPGNVFDQAVYSAFITVNGPIFGEATAVEGGFKVTVPEGVNGQQYIVLTSDDDSVTDDNTIAGPVIIEVTN